MGIQSKIAAEGLEGVVIAQTKKSMVNGKIGKLQYHGYDIIDLAENATFEEVIYLLWNNKLPTNSELDALKQRLFEKRTLRPQLIELMRELPATSNPMAVLRTIVSALGTFDHTAEDTTSETLLEQSILLTAIIPTIIATWERIRSGKEPLAPRENLDLVANFLYMLKGTEPDPVEVKALDNFLILLADHGMNASTFSARVTTATLSDIYSAVTTAIGTLKGPAHGGANQKAMEQFANIGNPNEVEPWFNKVIENGERIMGIGHRVYKAEDPRATILRKSAQELAQGEAAKWFEIAHQLEQLARSHDYFIERDLYANVDYYSAIVLYQIGIPVDQFTPLFAMSRVAGWTANVMEQWENNRLIRPRAEYVGPQDQTWLPLTARG